MKTEDLIHIFYMGVFSGYLRRRTGGIDMKREILFGAAYYPEYMPYDRIETDISMMKAAHMNVIRIAESTWSTLEPTDGTFDQRAGLRI